MSNIQPGYVPTALIATTKGQAVFLVNKFYTPKKVGFTFKRKNGLYIMKARKA